MRKIKGRIDRGTVVTNTGKDKCMAEWEGTRGRMREWFSSQLINRIKQIKTLLLKMFGTGNPLQESP